MRRIVFCLLLVAGILSEAGENIPGIVSLSPNLTELIFLLGRGTSLKGRSSACDWPEEAKKIPVVGSFARPNAEAVIQTGAKLVVSTSYLKKSELELLTQSGIQVKTIPMESFQDYSNALKELGILLHAREKAEAEIRKMNRQLQEIRTKTGRIPKEKRPKILIVIAENPIVTAGKKSYLNELIQLAGGRNCAENIEKNYFICSPEWLCMNPPDLIIQTKHGKKSGKDLTTLTRLIPYAPAVQKGRILQNLDDSLIYRIGPRTIQGIQQIRNFLEGSAE